MVGAETIIGPMAVLEDRVMVESAVEISNSSVAPETLVGKMTEVKDSIADGDILLELAQRLVRQGAGCLFVVFAGQASTSRQDIQYIYARVLARAAGREPAVGDSGNGLGRFVPTARFATAGCRASVRNSGAGSNGHGGLLRNCRGPGLVARLAATLEHSERRFCLGRKSSA